MIDPLIKEHLSSTAALLKRDRYHRKLSQKQQAQLTTSSSATENWCFAKQEKGYDLIMP
jgi:hypothetical protein